MTITDSDRIDALEKYINENHGLVLHDGSWKGSGSGSLCGLGLRPGYLDRSLRQAIDDSLLQQVKDPKES